MTRAELNAVVKLLMTAYGEKFNMNQDVFNVWYDCMGELRFDVAKKAASEYIRNSQYPPTVANIREQYDILWNAYKTMVRHIQDSFDVASGSYPDITDEQRESGKKLFSEIVKRYPREKKERIANELSRKIMEYVRLCEDGKAEFVTFDRYMERLANEFTG